MDSIDSMGLMDDDMWNTTRCATHDIEYYGCFCPECFAPKGGYVKGDGPPVNIRMTFGEDGSVTVEHIECR